MPKQTQNYRLGYFADGEFLDSRTESRRFETIDSQLFGLYSVLGNGILEGWNLSASTDQDIPGVAISPGRGMIAYVYTVTTESRTLSPLVPNSINYIYATLIDSSYWDQNIVFTSFLTPGARTSSIFLGSVTVNENSITQIDVNDRHSIGLISSIREVIANHRHTGAEGQPTPVDLSSEVQGQIRQSSLPELDASLITTGKIDQARIPELNHDTDLINKGTLTHSQLDAFVEQLSHPHAALMGETALTNLLQLILALKHQYPEIDDFLLNEIAFIPGISPDSIVDWDNTTANVDTRTALEGGTHTISGSPGPSFEVLTKTWGSNEEFLQASNLNVSVDGDVIRLSPTEEKAYVEDFENVSDWQTSIIDLSTGGSAFNADGTTFVGGSSSGALKLDEKINLAFIMEKNFQSQDWRNYNRIVFYIKTANLDHGDLYFYLRDSQAGTQDSYRLVLESGAPTINRDTLMQGWREINIDIAQFQRDSITSVGFYMSTDTGWEPSKKFDMNVDEMYLTTGNKFLPTGYSRFIYGNGVPLDFNTIRWDGLRSEGIKVRTRMGMDLSEFDEESPNQTPWSSYQSTSGLIISNSSGTLYPYIQIEVFMTAQDGDSVSPELHRLYLDFRTSSSEQTFLYDTKEEWESGIRSNIDTWSSPGWISIADTSEIGTVSYSQSGKIVKTDNQVQNLLEIAGSSLPKSTNQILNGLPSQFGQLSGITRGEYGSFWVADTDNDRVVEIDSSGNLVRGFYGSFISKFKDPYGLEERGPGSNQDDDESAFEDDDEESSQDKSEKVEALHSIYNPTSGILSVIFNQNIEDVYGADPRIKTSGMYLGAKAHRIYFGENTEMQLLGINGTKKEIWKNRENKYKEQFSFSSHVLNLKLSQADMATLSSIVDFARPRLTIASPKYNQKMTTSTITIQFSVSNFQIGGEDNNKIRYQIDYGPYQYSLIDHFQLSGLSEGQHSITATLVDGNNNPLENPEANLDSKFIMDVSSPIITPILSVLSPTPSQVVSSSPVSVSFLVENHPILPAGSHLRYMVDNGSPQEHRVYTPIQIQSLIPGEHLLRMMLVDEYGVVVPSEYSEVEMKFIIGANSDVNLKFYMDEDAVRGESGDEETGCDSDYVDVDIANIYMSNIMAPIDIQYIPGEISLINPSGEPSILVAKMRSPSWTECLSTTPSTTDETSIFGSPYLDGHSVVQLNMIGNKIFSNNAASFANSIEEIKTTLGSAEKISENEILIADASRKRAIITLANLEEGSTFVAWQYDSDRAVSDFHLVENKLIEISVGQGGVSVESLNVKIGTNVIWTNDSLVPIEILSGKTTQSQFNADPDLTLYGDEFSSGTLNPGEKYSYKFQNLGTFDWFSYDGTNLNTGVVNVSQGRVSSKDEYLVVENDPSASMFGSRVIRINSWGDVLWSFGEDWLHRPKDARGAPDGSVLIST